MICLQSTIGLYFMIGVCLIMILFLTKIYNLAELKSLGAKERNFLDAYDENIHRPMVLSEEKTV